MVLGCQSPPLGEVGWGLIILKLMRPYLLLTPGPLTTTETVKSAMMSDWCTWDKDYNEGIVEVIRKELVNIASSRPEEYTAVLMQGSGTFCVDAMSSFGGVPIDMAQLGIDFLISSANNCIQGVPGFGFIIARRSLLERCKGVARSLSLDIYDQWETMEKGHGKWRFTSPTHVVRAFMQALTELKEEGGVAARHARYCENHRVLVEGMRSLGYKTLLADEWQSPVITSFYYPSAAFDFQSFYQSLKAKGFVIYPGKISQADTFRIGNIGDVHPDDWSKP